MGLDGGRVVEAAEVVRESELTREAKTVTKLNQILAVEKGARSVTEVAKTTAYHAVQKRDLFSGATKTYEPRNDDGERLPPEGTLIVETVPNLVQNFSVALERLFDVTAVKSWANTRAKADVVVEGVTLLEGAPVDYLLFLEKQLQDVVTFLGKLPTLDPSVEWHWDSSAGVYRSTPVETIRSKKEPRAFVKAPATEKHPAQVEVFNEDVPQGTWTLVRFSSTVPVTQVAEWTTRARVLQAAVQMAREEANLLDVEDKRVARPLLDYVFTVPSSNGTG